MRILTPIPQSFFLRGVLGLAVLLGILGLAAYFTWPPNHFETRLLNTQNSPDGRWIAVVQLEVYTTAWVVNDAVYSVRLKQANHNQREGDLIMSVPAGTEPQPSLAWLDHTLLINLAANQSYQSFNSQVDGVDVRLQSN